MPDHCTKDFSQVRHAAEIALSLIATTEALESVAVVHTLDQTINDLVQGKASDQNAPIELAVQQFESEAACEEALKSSDSE